MKKSNIVKDLENLLSLTRDKALSNSEREILVNEAFQKVEKELERVSMRGILTPERKVELRKTLRGIKDRYEMAKRFPIFDRKGRAITVSIPE